MATCTHAHATVPKKDIERLPESQAGVGRHRCAECAYELGRRHAGEAEARLRDRVKELMTELDILRRQLAAGP